MKDDVGVVLDPAADPTVSAASPAGAALWRGLRVRVGCFSGAPDVERDAVIYIRALQREAAQQKWWSLSLGR